MIEEVKYLVCVGCGQRLCHKPTAKLTILALSCRCGAISPILQEEGADTVYSSMPASLMLAIGSGKKPPHIEFYLGRSAHTSPIKSKVEEMLRHLGAISEDECEVCRQKTIATGIMLASGEKVVTYSGKRVDGGAGGQIVLRHDPLENILMLSPEPSRELWNHSQEFNWGYGGSGPAQLALALLFDVTGDRDLSVQLHQRYKWEQVAAWGDEWQTTSQEIRAWVTDKVKEVSHDNSPTE